MIDKHLTINVLGAGNLAWHLASALHSAGHRIAMVYNRTEKSGLELADKTGAGFTSNPEKLDRKADLYLFCLSDQAITEISLRIPGENHLFVHTAGTVPLEIFKGRTRNYGVLYPLMSLSKNRKVDFSGVPICLEASNQKIMNLLVSLSSDLSGKVLAINSEQRKLIHLTAVFACNFPNHMYSIARELLDKEGLDFGLLAPLITETTVRALETDPRLSQTGPAARKDQQTMDKHIGMLNSYPEWQKIYTFVSRSISDISTTRDEENNNSEE